MAKHQIFDIINYLARDTAKAPQLNMNDDTIEQGAGFSPSGCSGYPT
jgi:hypothetical protein